VFPIRYPKGRHQAGGGLKPLGGWRSVFPILLRPPWAIFAETEDR